MRRIIVAATLSLFGLMTAFAASGDTVADRVFGQSGSFTTAMVNAGGISAISLNTPTNVAVDTAGRLYVADYLNSRVLEYDTPLTSQTANRVFGQAGNFTTNDQNHGGLSATSLNRPNGVAVDSGGRLYVADTYNSRVLEYDTPLTSQIASRVFGQDGSFATNDQNHGGISATSLNWPAGVAIDAGGRLYVADDSNRRVLAFDSPLTSQTAIRVFGQGGSFATNDQNHGGISAISLSDPSDVVFDSSGHLYVADAGNNRVLEYDMPLTSPAANRVFGQGGNFTTGTSNNGGISSGFANPSRLTVDATGHLFVADSFNYRVLEFDTPLTSMTASRVFGQSGNFTTNDQNHGGLSASSLAFTGGVAVDNAGNVYVGDTGNNRVLEYDRPISPAPVGGIAESPDPATLPTRTRSAGGDSRAARWLGVLALTSMAVMAFAVRWTIRGRRAPR